MTRFTNGTHLAKVLDQGFRSASTGAPQFYVTVSICGRYNPQGMVEECPRADRTFWVTLANERAVSLLQANLDAAGFGPLDDITRLSLDHPNPICLVGEEIDVSCTVDFLNGAPIERWAISRYKPMTAEAIQSLQTQFGHLLASSEESDAAPAPVPSTASQGDAARTAPALPKKVA
jgi:hypothetical protein